jgi:hypothetical protein
LYDTTSKELAGNTFGKGDDRVYFRLDAISGDPKTGVEFKNGTVREIKPTTTTTTSTSLLEKIIEKVT